MNNIQMNSHFRTMHYVEVLYMKGIEFLDRKSEWYPKDEAAIIFKRAVKKFTEDKSKNVIITLRDEQHLVLENAFRNY